MGNDGVASIDNLRVVSSLIEHTHVQTKNVGNVDGTSHTAFIRADDHHVVAVDLKIRNVAKKTLDKLVSRLYSLKSVDRDRILYPRVMGIEGDNVVDTHIDELLQCQCTVQGFPAAALVLTALIEERHDNSDAFGLAAHCRNDSLQILIMVIRRHMVCLAAQGIGQAVIAYVNHQIQVIAADRFTENALGLAASESGNTRGNNVVISLITFENDIGMMLVLSFISPLNEIVVDLLAEFLAAGKGNDAEFAYRNGFQISGFFIRHWFSPPL